MARVFNPFRLPPIYLYRVLGAAGALLLLFTGIYYDLIIDQPTRVTVTRVLACTSVLVFVAATFLSAWVRQHMGVLALATQLLVSGHLCVAIYDANLAPPDTVGAYIFLSVNALIFHRVALVMAYILVSCSAFVATGFAVPEPIMRTEVFALQAGMYACFLAGLVSLAVSARSERSRLEVINGALYDRSSDALIYGNLSSGAIQGMNSHAQKLFATDDYEQVGRLLRQAHRRVYADITPHDLAKQLLTDEIHETLKIQTAGGYSFWGDMVIRRLDIPDEDMLMIRIADVTEHIESETRLLEAQLLLDRAQTLARVGGWEYTRQGEWLFTESARALLDVPVDVDDFSPEVLGVDTGAREWVKRALGQCLQHARPIDVEIRVRSFSGRRLLVRIVGEAMYQGSEITKVVGMLRDVTDDRAREQELRDARDAAEAAAKARTEFLANVSHEIRTPMNGIIGMTSLLLDGSLTADQREQMTAINSSGQHLLALINELLDVAKIDAQQMLIERVPYHLGELIDATVAALGPLFEDKGLDFAVTWQNDALRSRQFLGDPLRIRQVITNLLSNAAKFTERGGVTLHVYREQADSLLCMRVVDTGIGIEPALLPKLFEAFRQADASITRNYGGTGLGLAICSSLAQLMDGELSAHSTVGKGSTFTLQLPAVELNTSRPSSAAEPAPQQQLSHLRVLVVEDNEVNQKVAMQILRRLEVAADLARDGLEALKRVREQRYDIVLMDMQMPRLDGLEASRRIRAMPELVQPVIIAMTANSLREDKQSCLAAGMDDFLPKPVRLEDMRRVLSERAALVAD